MKRLCRDASTAVKKGRDQVTALESNIIQSAIGTAATPVIADAIKILAPFASTDETRFVINRICFECGPDGQQVAVATTGKVMAILRGDYGLTHDPEKATRVLYNTNSVRELEPMEYPQWKQVVPRECIEEIAIRVDDMLPALRKVSITRSVKSYTVNMTIANNTLMLACNDPDVGQSVVSTGVKYNGKTRCAAYNLDYLSTIFTAAKKLGENEMMLRFTDELSPAVFTAGNLWCVLMPMRMS